jgi:diguanylate cyclase (GGDEF)-like protein
VSHQHQQNIEHLASHDSLTGLYNRAKFMECLVTEVALARRQQGRLAVLYPTGWVQPINDTHGHAVTRCCPVGQTCAGSRASQFVRG